MTLPCTLYPLGTEVSRYEPGQVLCDLSNGQTATVTLYPSIYYIRTQGAGGGGGNYAYPFGNGVGAGSGAGFEGYIRVKRKIVSEITTGVGGAAMVKGGDTILSNIVTLGGGFAGWTNDGSIPAVGAAGGAIDWEESDFFEIVSETVNSDGITAARNVGANSVLTNSGGGAGGGGAATAPGAGGGGTSSVGGRGGTGGYGECLVKYIAAYGSDFDITEVVE